MTFGGRVASFKSSFLVFLVFSFGFRAFACDEITHLNNFKNRLEQLLPKSYFEPWIYFVSDWFKNEHKETEKLLAPKHIFEPMITAIDRHTTLLEVGNRYVSHAGENKLSDWSDITRRVLTEIKHKDTISVGQIITLVEHFALYRSVIEASFSSTEYLSRQKATILKSIEHELPSPIYVPFPVDSVPTVTVANRLRVLPLYPFSVFSNTVELDEGKQLSPIRLIRSRMEHNKNMRKFDRARIRNSNNLFLLLNERLDIEIKRMHYAQTLTSKEREVFELIFYHFHFTQKLSSIYYPGFAKEIRDRGINIEGLTIKIMSKLNTAKNNELEAQDFKRAYQHVLTFSSQVLDD